MADRAISALAPTDHMTDADLFAINQGGQAKKVTWQVFYTYLAIALDGHGGINDISYTAPSSGSLEGTLTITLADGTSESFTVTNGRGITSIAKTGTSGLEDTYTISYNNGTTSTFKVNNGRGITGITKSSSGLTDTYTISYNDGTTSEIVVSNGKGISSVVKTPAVPPSLTDSYRINYNDGTYYDFTVDNGKGISSVVKTDAVPPSLTDTYRINYNDGTYYEFAVTNGKSISSIADKWAVSASDSTEPSTWYDDPPSMTPTNKYLWHYQIITFNDATTLNTGKAVVGVYGDTGQDWHVFIKWSEDEPTQNADMSDVPNNWIGIYSGTASTPPVSYTSYTWFQYKGEKGDTGTSITQVSLYSTSGLTDTYWVYFSDGTHTSFNVRNGSQIQSVNKTATTGLVDTYTVLLTDGSTTTFDVVNGKGISSISEIDVTHAAGHTDVYRFNFNDGDSYTFQIYNGANGSGSVSTVDGIESQNQNVTLLILGQGAPTTTTQGVLKQRYFDQTNSILYICVGIDTSGAEPTYTWQGTGVTVDSALSSMSTNPVQNAVLTAIIGTVALTTTAQTLTGAVNELNDKKAENTIIATQETSTTASKAYSVGDILILNGILYRVTSDIASGGTITVSGNNANVETDTVEHELDLLRESIDNLLIAEYDATDCSIVFRSAEVASFDSSDGSIIINV